MSHERNDNSTVILDDSTITDGSSSSQSASTVVTRGKWTDDRRLAAINALIKYCPFQQQQNHKLSAWNKVFEAVNETSPDEHKLGKTSIRQQIHTLLDSVDEIEESSGEDAANNDTTHSLKERTQYLKNLMKTSNRKPKRKINTNEENTSKKKLRSKSPDTALDTDKAEEEIIVSTNRTIENEEITLKDNSDDSGNSNSNNERRADQEYGITEDSQLMNRMERILKTMERTINTYESTSKAILKALEENLQATKALTDSQKQINQQLLHPMPMSNVPRYFPPIPYYQHPHEFSQRYPQSQPPPPQSLQQQQLAPRIYSSNKINDDSDNIVNSGNSNDSKDDKNPQ